MVDIFVTGIPQAQFVYQRQQSDIQNLEKLHLKYIYSDYWICNNLIFMSNENIICAVVNSQLKEGFNRYPAYLTEVQQAPRTAYVFALNSDPDKYLINQIRLKQSPLTYRIMNIPGYHVFVPV
ncbi:hypothetical protein KDAU_61220 [Dictyobacter aurantiacus]|uniref:Uncharacterized protein n=2 Tax=Dictyobacter aurantiacus TaxID=1936993 RepID=A0A401ZPK3_9CHLR|nr:hypothetical protein KDAU_61220 [Dictyobacter aurantiacus]